MSIHEQIQKLPPDNSPKQESALVAIFREMNLPQLLVLFLGMGAIFVPILNAHDDQAKKDRIEDAKDKAVMQVQISQFNNRLDKIESRGDKLLDTMEQIRDDVSNLKARMH